MTFYSQNKAAISRNYGSKVGATLKAIALSFVLMMLTGCASMTMDRQQAFTVQTSHENKEVTGINCALSNGVGTWHLTSPASVTVHKSAGDLVVDCNNERMSGNVNVASKINAAYSTNFLFLFGVGYIVDKYTGAGFDYPETVVVKLNPSDETGISASTAVSSTLKN